METKVLRGLSATNLRTLFAVLCGLIVLTPAGPALAGGLYLNEFGTPSMGVAGAGAEAVASDASTALHNPAGMTRMEGNELMLTGGLIYSTVEFDPDPATPIPGGDGGDAGGPAPFAGAFYLHSISDRLKLGVDVISLSGAVLDYDDSWTGRFLVQEVTIFTLLFNPTVAYRVNDWLSVAGGIALWYGTFNMQVAAPPPVAIGQAEIDGDDTEIGFNLAAMVELSERTRVGIIYWSEVEFEFGGDVKLDPVGLQVGVDTDLPMAQFVRLGIYHELNDRFALLGSIDWEDWSTLDNQNISTARGSNQIPRNWDDTWKFAVGLHYRPVDRWLLQVGIAYDTSPVDSDDRTPDMPIDRQIRYALGAQYKWSEKTSIGAQFEYADYGDAKIRNPLLIGDYKRNDIFFLGLNVNWKF